MSDSYTFNSWTMTIDDLEKFTGRRLTEKQFQEMCEEIEGRMDNFFNALIDDFYDNFEDILKEEKPRA